jgi:hypothetical protein
MKDILLECKTLSTVSLDNLDFNIIIKLFITLTFTKFKLKRTTFGKLFDPKRIIVSEKNN